MRSRNVLALTPWLVAALTLAVTACGRDAERRAFSWQGQRTMDGRIEVVTSPDAPALADSSYSYAKEWSVPAAAADTGSLAWADPVLLATGAGNAYVVDTRASRFYVISLDGSSVRTFGRSGMGPGEFRDPRGVAFVDGRLLIRDLQRKSIEVFDSVGAPLWSVPVGAVGFGLFIAAPPDRVLTSILTARGPEWRAYDVEGDFVPVAVPRESDPTTGSGPAPCHATIATRDAYFVAECALPVVEMFDREGQLERRFVIQRDSVRTPADILDAYRVKRRGEAAAAGVPDSVAESLVASLVTAMSVVKSIRGVSVDTVSGLIAIWDQQPDAVGGGNASLHLLAPNGVYLARLRFAEPWTAFTMTNGTLLALTTDPATGVVQLTRYRVTMPPGAVSWAAEALAALPP